MPGEGQYRGKSGEDNQKSMKLSSRQKEIVYGLILGDAYLQKTGKQNARLRLEHSVKQRAYMDWLYHELKSLFTKDVTVLTRKHPTSKQTYGYVRLQSHSSPWFGKLQRVFYEADRKGIPKDIVTYLKSSRTLAVWYMDDGYYDRRDRSVHIYLPKYSEDELQRLMKTLKKHFAIEAKYYTRSDRQACQINITGSGVSQFIKIVKPHIIPSMEYKLPSP